MATVQPIDKALGRDSSDNFEANDYLPYIRTTVEPAPGLFTALFSGGINDVLLDSINRFSFDDIQETAVLPAGKAFSEYGPRMNKDKARRLQYIAGSFGLTDNIKPTDYIGKFVPGTTDLQDEAYHVAKSNVKFTKAWSKFNELAIFQLLTEDTNITLGGPQPVYNYYTDLYGEARPDAIDMTLGDPALDPTAKDDEIWDMMSEALAEGQSDACLLYTSPSPRDKRQSRMPSSA